MAGVADTLRGFSDAELAALLGSRPDLTQPPLSTFNDLATRVSQPYLVHSVIERLDRFSRELVEALAYLDRGTAADVAALAAETIAQSEIEDGLRRLRAQMLALRRGDGTWELLPALHRMITSPFGLGQSYDRLFNALTMEDLRHVANGAGVTAVSPKPSLIKALVEHFEMPGRIAELIAAGGSEVEEVLRRIVSSNSVVMAPTQQYQRHRLSAPIRYAVDHGLLVALGWDALCLPSAVGKTLLGGHVITAFHSRPAPPRLVERASPRDGTCELRPAELIDAIARIGRGWGAAPVAALKTGAGGVSMRDIRSMAKSMGLPERAMARLVELAGVAGLVAHDWQVDRVSPTEAFDQWVALSAGLRWLALVDAWKIGPIELSRAGAKDDNDKAVAALARDYANDGDGAWRRSQVVRALVALHNEAPGAPIDPASVAENVTWGSPRRWAYRHVANKPIAFPALELVTDVLDELALLGLARTDALTEAGRAALAGSIDEALALTGFPEPVGTYTVSGDLTAVVPGEIDPRVLRLLEAMADTESRGAATVYRFTEAAVRRALDRGHTAEELLTHLSAHARPKVPQALRYLIEDVARRYGAVRAGIAVAYVRSDDAALLSEVARSKKAAKAKLRQIAPTVAVSSVPLEKIIPILREAGFLPVQEGDDGTVIVAAAKETRAKQPIGRRSEVDRRAAAEWLSGLGGASNDEPETVAYPPFVLETVKRLRRT